MYITYKIRVSEIFYSLLYSLLLVPKKWCAPHRCASWCIQFLTEVVVWKDFSNLCGKLLLSKNGQWYNISVNVLSD